MNLEQTTWSQILAYLIIAGGAVWALWKTVPAALTAWSGYWKNKKEQQRLDRTESAEMKKVELTHDLDVKKYTDEQIYRAFQLLEKDNDHLRDVIDQKEEQIEERDAQIALFREDEKRRGIQIFKKLRVLSEIRACGDSIENEILRLDSMADADKQQFLGKLALIKAKVEEYVKFLE